MKERVEGVGEERWSHVEVLRDLRESGHVVGGKKCWSFFSSERAKIQALRNTVLVGGGGRK